MTNKVLFVSNYYDGTGYSKAAIDYILALDSVGVDVVCRPLFFSPKKHPVPQRILELEQKSSVGSSVCIQHTLPQYMDFNGRFKKNIGLYASETSNFRASQWSKHLNMMDELWVINSQMVMAANDSGVHVHNIPISIVPHATDIAKFERGYAPLRELEPYKKEGDFVFYYVGEFNRRKNIGALVKAFNAEFTPDEPVQLVLKVGKPGESAEETMSGVREFCNKVKAGLRVRASYKDEVIISRRLSDDEVNGLHNTADCFVSASHGEAWCIPAFDAMGFGKTPIVPKWGGFAEYITSETGYPVEYQLDRVFGVNDSFSDLYTANETWAEVNVQELGWRMRECFTFNTDRKNKSRMGTRKAYEFSHQKVGEMMLDLLN